MQLAPQFRKCPDPHLLGRSVAVPAPAISALPAIINSRFSDKTQPHHTSLPAHLLCSPFCCFVSSHVPQAGPHTCPN